MNRLLVRISHQIENGASLEDKGVEYYEEIALLRDEIENAFRQDMAELHKVESFLEEKETDEDPFHPAEEIFEDE
jgi:molybdenum-dependent DNA-binding transcriptional regulator ModE